MSDELHTTAAPTLKGPCRGAVVTIAVLLSAGLAFCLSTLPSAASDTSAAPTVAAVKVARGELAQSVTFDAELRPFQEIDLHAKVSGFLDKLNVDAGDRVEAGQAIGTIEIPELKAELDYALASERRSQAANQEAHLSFTRLKTAADSQRGLISEQDLDIAKARDLSAEAARAEAQANVKKYRTMLDYTHITAPFAGVVTKRYVNTGALIQAGTTSSAVPLVRLSQNDKLRVGFPISLSFVARVKMGDPVEIRLPSAGKSLTGSVARFSRKVETATRTMEAEVDLPNADLALIPGVYATVVLK